MDCLTTYPSPWPLINKTVVNKSHRIGEDKLELAHQLRTPKMLPEPTQRLVLFYLRKV